MTSDARSTVDAYLKALENRDLAAFTTLVAEDAEYTIAGSTPVSGTWVGRDQILSGFVYPMAELFDPGTPYTTDVRRILTDGEHVAVETVTSATTAAGRPYRNAIVALFTVRDGRIRSMSEYFDTAYFAETLFGTR